MYYTVLQFPAKVWFPVVRLLMNLNSKLIRKLIEFSIYNWRDLCDKRAYIHMFHGQNLANL